MTGSNTKEFGNIFGDVNNPAELVTTFEPTAFPTINFIPKPQSLIEGVDALKKLGFVELAKFSGHEVGEDSEAGKFIISLKDAYVLMVTRIAERNPHIANYRSPKSYPEYEIYDSVQGILEDDQVALINSDFDVLENGQKSLTYISSLVYEGLNEIFCRFSGWAPGWKTRSLRENIVPLVLKSSEDYPSMPTTLEEVEEWSRKLFGISYNAIDETKGRDKS
jgi:hypothetical protein